MNTFCLPSLRTGYGCIPNPFMSIHFHYFSELHFAKHLNWLAMHATVIVPFTATTDKQQIGWLCHAAYRTFNPLHAITSILGCSCYSCELVSVAWWPHQWNKLPITVQSLGCLTRPSGNSLLSLFWSAHVLMMSYSIYTHGWCEVEVNKEGSTSASNISCFVKKHNTLLEQVQLLISWIGLNS